MAILSLNVERGRTAADGSIPVRIKITSKNTKAYISTKYKVGSIKNWNGTAVIKHPDAPYINKKLRELMVAYECILDSMPNANVTANEIKKYLESQIRKSNFLKDFAEEGPMLTTGGSDNTLNADYKQAYEAAMSQIEALNRIIKQLNQKTT